MTPVLIALGIASAGVWGLLRLRRRPGPGWKRKMGIGLGWLTAGLLVLWATADLWSRNLLEEERKKALQLGPLDFKSLLPPMPLGDENGCLELMQAGELLKARQTRASAEGSDPDEKTFYLSSTSRPWTAEESRAARKVMGKAGDILALARQGADRPHIRYTLQTDTMLVALQLPHLSHLKNAGQFLMAVARIEAGEGRTDQALEDLGRVARIGRGLEEEPILISCLVSLALRNIACQGIDEALAEGARASPEAFAKLTETLRMNKDLEYRAFLGERCMGVDAYERLIEGQAEQTLLGQAAGGSLPARPWLRWQEAVHLRILGDMVSRAEEPDVEAIPKLAVLPRMLVPVLSKVRTSLLTCRSLCDATRWALAVLRYNGSNGRLPATLNEIPVAFLPDRPLDPWTGKPFLYKLDMDGDGFTLYGLGENRRDDGGDLETSKEKPCSPDIGVRWKVAP